MSQKEFAVEMEKRYRIPLTTYKAYEEGSRKVTENLAGSLMCIAGVFAPDLQKEGVPRDFRGKPYTKESYQLWTDRVEKQKAEKPSEIITLIEKFHEILANKLDQLRLAQDDNMQKQAGDLPRGPREIPERPLKSNKTEASVKQKPRAAVKGKKNNLPSQLASDAKIAFSRRNEKA